MSELVLFDQLGAVCTLQLNRPQKLNCMTSEMLHLFDEKLVEIERHEEVKVVLIRGTGERAFSTGADLKEFQSLNDDQIADWIRLGHRIFDRLESLSKSSIAVIQGYAYGGGLELALACDFRLATSNAVFCAPELKHGWIPGWGAMARLSRLVGETRAKEIVFLAEPFDAETAERLGLVSRVLEPEQLETEVATWCERLSQLDSRILALAKSSLSGPRPKGSGTDVMFDVLATQYARARGKNQSG